jgi:PST family polysaccharide transporter
MRDLFKFIRIGTNSTIGKNIISLYLLQISYYILPLITVPYLVRVLEPEKYGLVAFGQSLIAFFAFFVNYGFDLTATREISKKRSDNREVSRIACGVWTAKALLCLIGFSVLLFLILYVRRLGEISLLLIILYGIAVGNMLFPNWLFLGLERMKAISIINLSMRTITTMGVFILIRSSDDYLFYAGLLSFQWIFAGLIGAWFAFSRLKIRVSIPKITDVFSILSKGSALFVSNIAQCIYYSGNSFILGILTNYSTVGYYNAAEKITLSLLGLFKPVAYAVYPRFSRVASSSKNTVLLWGKRLIYVMGSIGLVATITVFIGASMIVNIVLGSEYEPSVTVLKILSILPLIMALSDVLSLQIMLPFNKDNLYTMIRVLTATLHVVLALLLIPRYRENGMAFVFVISQSLILISTFLCLWYWRLTPFHHKMDETISQSAVQSS